MLNQIAKKKKNFLKGKSEAIFKPSVFLNYRFSPAVPTAGCSLMESLALMESEYTGKLHEYKQLICIQSSLY